MLTLDPTHTLWDIWEFKFIVLFITIALAVWLGNWLHDKSKGNKDE